MYNNPVKNIAYRSNGIKIKLEKVKFPLGFPATIYTQFMQSVWH